MKTYGTELWDNIPAIETHTQEGIEQLTKILDFFKKRSAIEASYAKELTKLSESFKDKKKKAPQSSIGKAWESLLDGNEHLGKIHAGMAHFADAEICNSVKNVLKLYEGERKQKLNDVKIVKNELKKYYDSLDKAKKSYETACKVADEARAYAEKVKNDMNATKAQEEKAKEDAAIKSKKAEDADDEYQRVLRETNDKQSKHYKEDLPDKINLVQSLEESRVDSLKATLTKYYANYIHAVPEITAQLNKMIESSNSIDKAADSAAFISTNKLNATIPPSIPYENFFEKLNKSGKITKKKDEDDLILESMAPEKAYKKAQLRIKELDKETKDIESKKEGVQTLLEMYESNPQFADAKAFLDVAAQLDDLEAKVDTLKLKRYKYESFIAAQDQKETPPMPVLYADGKEGPLANTLRASVLGSKASTFNLSALSLGGDTKKPGSQGDIADRKYRVLYDFEGSGDHELTVKKDDVVTIIDKSSESGWCKAKDSRGKEGFVPSTYVEELQ